MTSLSRWSCLLLILLSGSILAFGDSLTVGSPATSTTLTIQDSALTALNSGWAKGVGAYIDPYHGTLDGQSVLLFCVDPDHLDDTTPNYGVNVSQDGVGNTTLQELNILNAVGLNPDTGYLSLAATNAGFSPKNVPQLYGGLAWLSEQLQQSNNTLTQQELQAAIWQLGDYTNTFTVVSPPAGFNPTINCSLTNTQISTVTCFEDEAKAYALTSGFEVVTDANEAANGKNAGQEYIVLTPEPSTVLLSLSGLFWVFAFRRRRSLIAE